MAELDKRGAQDQGGQNLLLPRIRAGSAPLFSTDPRVIESALLATGFANGARETDERFGIVGECREAVASLRAGEIGVVIGVGGNNPRWHSRGWITFDIDPTANADILGDANYLSSFFPSNGLHYILAEFIRMDPKGTDGVGWARLLLESNKVLAPRGKLIIETAHNNLAQSSLPDRDQYLGLMERHGFKAVVEVHESYEHDTHFEQRITYYGEKVRDGFK